MSQTHELRHLARDLFPKYIQPAFTGNVPLTNSRQLFQEARQLLRLSLRQVYSRHGMRTSKLCQFIADFLAIERRHGRATIHFSSCSIRDTRVLPPSFSCRWVHPRGNGLRNA